MSRAIGFVGNNAIQIDAVQGQETLREECPELLQDGEVVLMAFQDRGGAGRDDSFLTSKRLLIRDKKLLTGKKVKYLSLPYESIRSFSVETGGTLDSDSTLKVVSSDSVGEIKIDFVKKHTDTYAVQMCLAAAVLVGGAAGAEVPHGAITTENVKVGSSSVFDWLGDDAAQMDATTAEEKLKSGPNRILLPDESVELAFKCGRDSFLLTSKRLLLIDVKGLTGKRIKYTTVLWSSLRAFEVQTAGKFDRDSELLLFTDIAGRTRINIDLRKGKTDLYAVQRFFADKVLGMDTVDPSADNSKPSWTDKFFGGVFSWLGDDSSAIDASKVDKQFHEDTPILQHCEKVEMAFKGRRDLILFTTKRLITVDLKGLTGKKTSYLSIPWSTVQSFGVRSSGSLDKDSEFMIWTDFDDITTPTGKDGSSDSDSSDSEADDGPLMPIPRNSFLEFDFQKDSVDLTAVHRYLSERCLRTEDGGQMPWDVLVSPDLLKPASPNAVSSFISWLGDDASAVDPSELDQRLHTGTPMLQADEHIAMAYRVGRDMVIFTTKRILTMDTQGASGKRVEWVSVPYSSVRAFTVESAGTWDNDVELKIFCKTYWMDGAPGSTIAQDFRKGKADIIAIQGLLSAQVMGSQDGSTTMVPGTGAEDAGHFDSFVSFFGDDAVATDAKEVNEKLHSSPAILLSDETVDVSLQMGRDMCIFTTKRVLLIDRQGLRGKKIEYASYPLRYCAAFNVQSAAILGDNEVTLYTDIPGVPKVEQDLKKGSSDIWSIQKLLAEKMLRE